MDRIILIETSAAVCSTALVQDGRIVCSRLCEDARQQASLTAHTAVLADVRRKVNQMTAGVPLNKY